MGLLEKPIEKSGVSVVHFPVPFLAVIWRNWGLVEQVCIAKALKISGDVPPLWG